MRVLIALLVVTLLGCTTEAQGPPRADPTGQPSPPASPPTLRPPPNPEPIVLAVPAFAPRPQLTSKAARRLSSGKVDTWRGLRVVMSARRLDGSSIAVLPISRVKPWMRTALVDGVDPVRDPRAYPLRGTTGPPRPITVSFAGDVMLGRRVPDPLASLAAMGPRLASADLTLGNFESTLSRAGSPTQGGDSFAADPRVLRGLRRAGFDAVSLANNHAGDYGDQALLETVDAFRRSTVRSFGAGKDLAAASRPFVTTIRGTRFGVIGFNAIGETPRATADSPGALSIRMPPRTGPLNQDDLRHVLGLVRRLDRRVDVVIVMPHWGTQYTHVAEPSQRYVARRLVDAGADLVVGGHPHWVQGLEYYRDTVIAHSLGNFVFDMDFMTKTMQGVVLEATFWGDELKAVDLVPYVMDAAFVPRSVTGGPGSGILGDVWRHSTVPFRSP